MSVQFKGYHYQNRFIQAMIDELLGTPLTDIADRICGLVDERDSLVDKLKEANERIAELEAEQAA